MKTLSTEAKAAKNAYMREWRKKNPDKQRDYAERYWVRKATEMEAAESKAAQDVQEG